MVVIKIHPPINVWIRDINFVRRHFECCLKTLIFAKLKENIELVRLTKKIEYEKQKLLKWNNSCL